MAHASLGHITAHAIPGHISGHANPGHTSGHTCRGHTLSPQRAAPRGWGASSAPSQAGHTPSNISHPGPHLSYHDPRAQRAGTVCIWDIFVQHQSQKSFSVKFLVAFGSPDQKRTPSAFSQGWLRWVPLFKGSSAVHKDTSVLPDPSHRLQTTPCAQ